MKSKEEIARELDLIFCEAGRTKKEALIKMAEYIRNMMIEERIDEQESHTRCSFKSEHDARKRRITELNAMKEEE